MRHGTLLDESKMRSICGERDAEDRSRFEQGVQKYYNNWECLRSSAHAPAATERTKCRREISARWSSEATTVGDRLR